MDKSNTSANTDRIKLIIDGFEYDVTEWRYHHPGGDEIIEKYNGKDASDAFHAFHDVDTFKYLKTLKPKPISIPVDEPLTETELASLKNPELVKLVSPERLARITTAWKAFRQKIVDAGLLQPDYSWYVMSTAATLSLLTFGILFGLRGWWLISAIMMGLFWQQSGWLSHEYCHHQVFGPRRRVLNTIVAYFLGNFLQGYSINWWKERHNIHHAITNVHDADPDIDNLPLFMWTEEDAARIESNPTVSSILPYQHLYFPIFTPALRLIWCLQSWRFSQRLRNHKNLPLKHTYFLESSLLVVHWAWVIPFMMYTTYIASHSFISWISLLLSYFLISEGIGGCFLAIIVFLSHTACDIFPATLRKQLPFVDLQVYTTRNMSPGIFMDWFAVCILLLFQLSATDRFCFDLI